MPKKPFGLKTAWLILGLLIPILCIQYGMTRSSVWLVPVYGIAFLSYLFIVFKVEFSIKQLMIVAVVIRLTLFFGSPSLSDDYFRFIWDGQIWSAGISPYQSTPEALIDGLPDQYQPLYESLNSQVYHSTYPPFSQYIFSIPSLFGVNDIFWSMTVMRVILLLFEMGAIYLLFHLTKRVARVLIYALNPLVMLELTANLHFEGVVIFFILLAWWFYQQKKWVGGSVALSFGVLTKLTPLMFLPILLKKLGWRKSLLSYFLIGFVLVIFFLPFLSLEIVAGLGSGLDLFFRKFEFNAGLFFLVREMGFWIKGYDVVQTAGPWLSVIALVLIVSYSVFIVNNKTEWAKAFSIVLFIQLLFATTVHPWYIIPLLAFSSITKFAFPLVWSGLIFLSYLGYSDQGYQHPLSWIALEYVVVIGLAAFELLKNKPLLENVE
ncbi:glycosyltransferase family 87 protein [Reichenbachiella sp.]|uniref:glycosyltransferase family 87 protein n=1 Tax=Reichenbachiella sp. TaxID=2184521 RepID=UPI003BB098F3